MLCSVGCVTWVSMFHWHVFVTLISLRCIFPWKGNTNTARVSRNRSNLLWCFCKPCKDCLHLQECNSFGNLAPELQSRCGFIVVCLNATVCLYKQLFWKTRERERRHMCTQKTNTPLALIPLYIRMNRAIKRCRASGNTLEGNYSIILCHLCIID